MIFWGNVLSKVALNVSLPQEFRHTSDFTRPTCLQTCRAPSTESGPNDLNFINRPTAIDFFWPTDDDCLHFFYQLLTYITSRRVGTSTSCSLAPNVTLTIFIHQQRKIKKGGKDRHLRPPTQGRSSILSHGTRITQASAKNAPREEPDPPSTGVRDPTGSPVAHARPQA